MYLILNSDNEIKGVGVTTNPEYKSVYVDENADMFPFKGWSEAKICCYKVNVSDGIITMMTPYVDSRMLEHINQLGTQNEDTKETLDLSLGITIHNAEDRNYIAQQMCRLQQLTLDKADLSEEESLEVADLYPLWEVGKEYKVNQIVKWEWDKDGFTQLWKVLQQHISQEDWKPDVTPSLFKQIGFTPSGYPIWVQPIGSVDAYQKGDIVSHNDKNWISDIDNNVWMPSVYGWSEYTE